MDVLPPSRYVRLRGLPFSAKEEDVRTFLKGLMIRTVTFTLTLNGRASGECYVEFEDLANAAEAKKLDKEEMSGRYIEVFPVTEGELSWMICHDVIRVGDSEPANNFVVRLRGIPFSATADDIKEFFKGLDVADVVIDKEPGGRPSGEAFVRLASKEHAEQALERNKQNMGTRYVEVFRSSSGELESSKSPLTPSPYVRGYKGSRPQPILRGEPVPLRCANPCLRADRYDEAFGGGPMRGGGGPMRGGAGGYGRYRSSPYDLPYDNYSSGPARMGMSAGYGDYNDAEDEEDHTKVHMRGLPYNASALEIEEFFKPLNCVDIRIGYNEDRRPSGDAYVVFSTLGETREALSRNKRCIGSRYIELFSGNNAPMARKYVSYKRVGGTGMYSTPGLAAPAATPMNRVGYVSFEEEDLRTSSGYGPSGGNSSGYGPSAGNGSGYGPSGGNSSGYGPSGGQQYYADEYEGRQYGYGRPWGGAGAGAAKTWM